MAVPGPGALFFDELRQHPELFAIQAAEQRDVA